MVTQLGMSELGPILYGSEHGADEVFLGRDFSAERTYSEETAAKIDEAIKKIIDEAYASARRILTENIKKLHFVAEFLVKYEVMDDQQFKVAMEKEDPTFEELDGLVAEKRRISEEENRRVRELEEQERRKREQELAERDKAYRESLEDVNRADGDGSGGARSEEQPESDGDSDGNSDGDSSGGENGGENG